MAKYVLAAIYIGLVVAANLMTTHIGLLDAGFGLMVTAGTFAAGLVIAVRNPLQETGGRLWVVGCILLGAVLSLLLGTGRIGLASGVTFLVADRRWATTRQGRVRHRSRFAVGEGGAGPCCTWPTPPASGYVTPCGLERSA